MAEGTAGSEEVVVGAVEVEGGRAVVVGDEAEIWVGDDMVNVLKYGLVFCLKDFRRSDRMARANMEMVELSYR